MPQKIQIVVSPREAAEKAMLQQAVAQKLRIKSEEIKFIQIERKSIDARSRQPKINLSLNVFCGDEKVQLPAINLNYHNVGNQEEVLIVGSGPAGLFAALRLIELDFKPIILERGNDVSQRKRDIAAMIRAKTVNEKSNYCYGEGGAGTFSDGKLYTRSNKRGDTFRVFQIFHFHGAQDEILYESHPHIGTDRLPEVIKNMRKTITDCGGEIHYASKVSDFIISGEKIVGVACENGNTYKSRAVVLATGHSARDVYELLQNKNIEIEAKNFAVGVRVEHPQTLIDSIQYHCKNRGEYLPAANYAVVTQAENRGVYSFCMCPGGYIVPASTAANEIVVNGMSSSQRHTAYANSGIVVETHIEDLQSFMQYENLCGIKFQQSIEQAAFANGGGGQVAPAQRLADFVNSRISQNLPSCSYIPGTHASPLHEWLPAFIAKRLQQGFRDFDKKMHGFLTNEAVIVGVESRSSSPIRIPRDAETMQHISIGGLFPCGEGAGYAGGITSSAVDGENCAQKIAEFLKSK